MRTLVCGGRSSLLVRVVSSAGLFVGRLITASASLHERRVYQCRWLVSDLFRVGSFPNRATLSTACLLLKVKQNREGSEVRRHL